MNEIFARIKALEIKMVGGDGLFLKANQAQHDLPDSLLGHVVIKSLWEDDEDDPNLVGRVDVAPAGRRVTGIYGGQLLGLEMPGAAAGNDGRAGRKGGGGSSSGGGGGGGKGFVSVSKAASVTNFQWFDWQTLQPVGTVLPAPRLVVWDPELQYCLTAYARSFVVWAMVIACHLRTCA
jgi:hypothetical protein